jgi:hypothetical protein
MNNKQLGFPKLPDREPDGFLILVFLLIQYCDTTTIVEHYVYNTTAVQHFYHTSKVSLVLLQYGNGAWCLSARSG